VPRRTATTILFLTAATLSTSACGYSAATEEGGDGPAKVESIDDSDLGRVVLKAGAAKRIGLETAPVTVGRVDHRLIAPGTVVGPTAGHRSVSVRVTLPGATAGSVDASRPARILSLGGPDGLVAPATAPPQGVASGGGGALYYRLDGAGTGLHAGQQLRVQLEQRGGGQQKTVPYSAVIYWIDGGTWVDMRAGPLAFVRTPIEIQEVDGDVAILSSGPPAGTQVVSIGGQELLGTEFQIEGE
jgi:hypothetical protein